MTENSNLEQNNNVLDINTIKQSIKKYFTMSDYHQSLIESHNLLLIDENNAFAKLYYAMSLYRLYNIDTMIKLLQVAVEIEVDSDALFTLGVLFYEKDNFNTALKYFLLAKELQFNSEINYRIALCYSALGDYSNADQYLLQAIKINPSDLKLYDELRYVYTVQNKDLSEFIELLRKNSNVDANLNNIDYINYVANQFFELGDFSSAIEFFSRSLNISATLLTYFKIAQCYYNLSDLENAKTNIESALEIDKDNMDIKLLYLIIMHDLKIINDNVKTVVTDLINQKGESLNPMISIIVYEVNGDILFNDGNFFESIKSYEKSITNYKQIFSFIPIDLEKKLALAYEKNNQIDNAIAVLEDLNTNFIDENIMSDLARLYFQIGNIDKAGELITKIKDIKQNN